MRRSPRIHQQERQKSLGIFIASDGENEVAVVGQTTKSSPQEEEVAELSASIDLVKAILLMQQTQLPIKRTDLAKVYGNKLSSELIKDARIRLRSVFGLDLVEVEDRSNVFLVVKTHVRKNRRLIRGKVTDVHDAILSILLGYIMMSKKNAWIRLDDIYKFLGSAHIKLDIEINNGLSVFTVKELVTKIWPQQLYLTTRKGPNKEKDEKDDKDREFRWGPRARVEFDRMQMLHLMAKIMNSKASDWKEQYQMLVREQMDGEETGESSSQSQRRGVERREELSQRRETDRDPSPEVDAMNEEPIPSTSSGRSSQRFLRRIR